MQKMKTDVWSKYPADCRNCRFIIPTRDGRWWCTKQHIILTENIFKYFKDCPYYEKVKVKAEK